VTAVDDAPVGAAEKPAAGTTPGRADRVAVVGGGLAGIAAALRCADAGARVTLYEASPRLGGLTYSFPRDLPHAATPQDQFWVDNGQHVFLRCCTAYRQLLQRLGVEQLTRLQPRLDIPVRGMAGPSRRRRLRTARLRAGRSANRREPAGQTGWPAPYHLAGALLRYPWMHASDLAGLPRVLRALRRLDPAAADVDAQTFGAWLAGLGQSRRATESLWDLIGVATLNAHAEHVSLALAATVFQLGLLDDPHAADIGMSAVPLSRLHGDAALQQLRQAGVGVCTRSKVTQVAREGARWRIVRRAAEPRSWHDAVIVAASPAVTERLLPPGLIRQDSGWSQRLGTSPIINLHLLVDRQVLDEPFLATVGGTVQWIFDRTQASGLTDQHTGVQFPGQYLAVSLSAADNLVDRPVAELRASMLPELATFLPRLAQAEVIDFFVTRERHATFRPAPGTAGSRPSASTAAPTLTLAGAWTQTRWPATMEGAVRSGNQAAELITNRVR
jgi:squalene-associated FAD-dependent desaturase